MKSHLFFMLRAFAVTLLLWSCGDDDKVQPQPGKTTFSFQVPENTAGLTSGTLSASYKLKHPDGTTASEKKDVTLTNGHWETPELSLPGGHYELLEFLILDGSNHVIYAAPVQGSAKAPLVTKPLPMGLDIDPNTPVQAAPELLALEPGDNAAAYGYESFGGAEAAPTIRASFSSFISTGGHREATPAHIKIEALDANTEQAPVKWSYETDLEATPNAILLRKESFYRITATKDSYTWKQTLALNNGAQVEIVFEALVTGANDVYVAGTTDRAVYWKNGQQVILDNNVGSMAARIFVSGQDVYVSGTSSDGHPVYWKNGEKVVLSNELLGEARDIIVVDHDVYVTASVDITGEDGFPVTTPAYWKNDVLTTLPVLDAYASGLTSAITLDGGDVYITGLLFEDDGQSWAPMVWKNGEATRLPANEQYAFVEATDIKVANGHVYISGTAWEHPGDNFSDAYALLWVDGELHLLSSSVESSKAVGLDVVDGDVYVVGNEGTTNTGKYWKNYEETIIGPGMSLVAISIVGDDVYTAGVTFDVNLLSISSYWLNGEITKVGGPEIDSFASGLFVAPRP